MSSKMFLLHSVNSEVFLIIWINCVSVCIHVPSLQCGKDFVEVFQGQQKQFKLNHKFPPATSCRFRLRVLNDVGWR